MVGDVAVGSEFWPTEAFPVRNMAVRRINNAVRELDWSQVETSLNPPDGSDGVPFELCDATQDDWWRYVQSEQQELRSRWMVLYEGKVLIVELPGILHEEVVQGIGRAMRNATGTDENDLRSHGASYIGNHSDTLPADVARLLEGLEPDASFGPRRNLPEAELPPGFDWALFHTLKVEIGVSQTWSARGGLDYKANAWRQCPGVQYVLCIHISPGLNVCEYRLDSIVNGQFEPPRMHVTTIDNNSDVAFDARRLLGLPPGANLPAGFNDPVEFNLLNYLQPILADRQAGINQERARAAAAAAADGQPPRQRQCLQ